MLSRNYVSMQQLVSKIKKGFSKMQLDTIIDA